MIGLLLHALASIPGLRGWSVPSDRWRQRHGLAESAVGPRANSPRRPSRRLRQSGIASNESVLSPLPLRSKASCAQAVRVVVERGRITAPFAAQGQRHLGALRRGTQMQGEAGPRGRS